MNTGLGVGLSLLVILDLSAPALGDPPSGRLLIQNAHSNLCLSPAGGTSASMIRSFSSIATMICRACGASSPVSGDMVEVVNLNSALCLTVAGGNTLQNDPAE